MKTRLKILVFFVVFLLKISLQNGKYTLYENLMIIIQYFSLTSCVIVYIIHNNEIIHYSIEI